MIFPKLVPDTVCKIPITLCLDQDGRTKYGDPLPRIEISGKCNYQDQARYLLTDQKQMVVISGTAYFNGDICPELPVISGGEAWVFGERRHIQSGRKARNPDGTVNYTEVFLR